MTVKKKSIGSPVVPYLRSPGISYNSEQIAFSYARDIWIVPNEGGEARMVTSHNGYDDKPRFSPDGSNLAFVSRRTGNGDIYVMSLKTEDVRRVTLHDGMDTLGCWSPDSQWLYFSSGRGGIGTAAYKTKLDGGTPVKLGGDPFESYYNMAISSDGKALAFNNNGDPWWRRGPNPPGGSQIWIVGAKTGSNDYRRIVDHPGRNMWPMWDPENAGLYFVSDRNDNENIWYISLNNEKAEQITQFTDGRLLRPSISGNGKYIVFERNFEIWMLNLDNRESASINIEVRADRKQNDITHRTYSGDIQEFALSQDNKKILFINRGRLFATSADKGTEKGRISFPLPNESSHDSQITWSPDSQKAVYVSDRSGENQLYLYNFQEQKEERITDTSAPVNRPRFSPDGKWLAYFHGKDEICLINSETMETKPFIKNIHIDGVPIPPNFTWSPDNKWIAFLAKDENFFSNVYVQNIEDNIPKQITFLSHISGEGILWSPDGKYIIFNTSQYRTQWQIARVDLQPVQPEFREDEFHQLFKANQESKGDKKESEDENKEEKKEEDVDKKPVKIELGSIKQRLRFLTSPQVNASAVCISPDSKILIFRRNLAGKTNLWSMCFDQDRKSDPPKQITSTNGGKGAVYFASDGKRIFYIDSGKVNILKIAENGGNDGGPKTLETRAEMNTDWHKEKMQMFHEAWRLMRDHFYDPQLHGADWDAIKTQLLPVVHGLHSQDDFHEILNLMVGELNASHLGAGGGGGGISDSCLGVEFDPVELEESGRFKVINILPDGPAALPEAPVKVGEYILALDGVELNNSTNIWQELKHKSGKKVTLTVNIEPAMENTREVIIQPVNPGALGNLQYKNWVRSNAEYVHHKSEERLGYVHINAMSYEAYMQFLVDLDTETHSKEGVVVDVRFNGGGHTASFFLDVLRKQSYVNAAYRGLIATSSTNLAGNRILDKPSIIVQNEHSGSNTEMFSEGFRRFGLGKVVGMPTSGAVIWTTNINLLDGTWFRVPFIQISTADGENLEGKSRQVDIQIDRPLGESAQNVDTQLDTAIEHLLISIDQQT